MDDNWRDLLLNAINPFFKWRENNLRSEQKNRIYSLCTDFEHKFCAFCNKTPQLFLDFSR